jgi:beta-phosphoglucomutase-like phosphatase (HAD superfamily)
VASSSSQVELERALEIAGVADLLTEHATGDDAERSKPAPDVVAVGLEKLRLEAPEVRLIGDSPYDIKAGAQVGVAVVAVQCGGFSDAELAGAEEIFDDPADVTRDLEHVIRGASQ